MVKRGKRTEKVLPMIFKKMEEDYSNMYEIAYLFNSEGGIQEKWIGTREEVEPKDFLENLYMFRTMADEFVVAAHTHVNNFCFSLMDWDTLNGTEDRFLYMVLKCPNLFYVLSPGPGGYKKLDSLQGNWLKLYSYLNEQNNVKAVDWQTIRSCGGKYALNAFVSYVLNAQMVTAVNSRLEAFPMDKEGDRILKIFERERQKLIL
jgi:hypothetical protein